ncbi:MULTISPECIES: hypothetical protein [Ponticoccus]|uniref:Glyceraldehyde-3-phosphate dehydrogenase n=1 Tax=Ponticoccus litoralis TaxID=422297 RepID=A0AAW9S4Q2_9RHOB|nr:hypothetical protein [Ponticoccus alexandrii]ETA52126.1 glyceraldehyde-3-phosphate dehydrogenase [Rhodobacteraceae bacterium PD-2]
MTNSLAIALGLAIAAFVAADLLLFDGTNLLFLARKLYWLIDWLAFWR